MDIHQIDGIGPNVSLKDTWIKMKENNIKTLPILRDEELLVLFQPETLRHLIWMYMII